MWVIVLGMVAGCSPRYASRPEPVAEKTTASVDVSGIVSEADEAYEKGVGAFVEEDFDSARLHFQRAIDLLSKEIDWSADDTALGERRVLLYKCRYFLERIPAVAREIPYDTEIEEVKPLKPQLPDIEVVENAKVRKWVRYFTGDGRATFQKWIRRSGKYRETTNRILIEEGLPLRMTNLALIESGFNPNAYSRAHAVGMWQFIRSTARIYGLRVDWWVDERRDLVKSCRAASQHLRDLHSALGSWPLAMAAYNCGQRNVERAMKRSRSRDYWDLRLPRETRDYVPKFMAACMITENPEAYGFTFVYDDHLDFEVVELDPKTDLRAVARACGVALPVIKDLNPNLIRGCTPDGDDRYPVRIPSGKTEVCLAALQEMPEEERMAKIYESPAVRHTVRRGETLSRIARRYGTTISAIAKANRITNHHRIRIGQVLLIPGEGYVTYPDNPGVHVVRRGETLSSIGHRYGIRIKELMAWNDLRSPHVIYTGQKLVVSLDRLAEAAGGEYVVRKGDTVAAIAHRHGVDTDEVLAANQLRATDRIYPGQELRIPSGEAGCAGALVHVVRRGETVSEIARNYSVSTTSVLRANGLSSRDRIYPGQEIDIPGAAGAPSSGAVMVHTVKAGESVWAIAQSYGVSTGSILASNGLSSRDRIYPGQEIKIPGVSDEGRVVVHEVRRGETITSIARKYGASIPTVLRANGLGSRDKIYPGQKIKVPM
jgi:membrane-bound lytic murein transglycosylase D